jgi:hypothetical protein
MDVSMHDSLAGRFSRIETYVKTVDSLILKQ